MLVYLLTPPATNDHSFLSLVWRFVESLLYLEPSRPTKWEFQTNLFLVTVTLLLLSALIGLALCSQRPNGPWLQLHIGNRNYNCCSIVFSVGVFAACIFIVVAVWYVYQGQRH